MIIQTEIEIAAPPTKVWRALCDFESYRKWNPCRDGVGVAGLGEKVTLMIGLNPKKRRKIAAVISALNRVDHCPLGLAGSSQAIRSRSL